MARKWWTLTAVLAGMFMLLLDVTIVNVALPQIQKAFSASLPDLQWIIDAYALTLAALMLTAGALADRFGLRPSFAVGTAIFTPGRCCAGWRPARLTSRCHGPGRASAARSCSPPRSHCSATRSGARTAGSRSAPSARSPGSPSPTGPVIGGVITSGLSWRWIFLVNVPIGIATIAVTLAKVAESRDPDAARPDWLGFASFSAALASLVYGLIRACGGWGSAKVIAQPGRLGGCCLPSS